MKLVVISPESLDPRETDLLPVLFSAGLERYHVRKPHVTYSALAAWLAELPADSRARIVLHQHHELVDTLGLGGRHDRDLGGDASIPSAQGGFRSRSCHDLGTVRAVLGSYDAVFFGPVFPSISKPGYGLARHFADHDLASLLKSRPAGEGRTEVIALGGVTPASVARCRELGFDGVAVLGAVWHAPDPVRAFGALQEKVFTHAH